MKLNRLLLLLIAAISMLGCDMKQIHKDVSSDPEYRDLVGATCELLVALRAHGVALKLEKDKKTDYVSIWNPGFSGPERTFVVPLQPGTHMQVISVRECTNCLFSTLVEYQVSVIPEPREFGGKPAFVRAESFTPQHVRCESAP